MRQDDNMSDLLPVLALLLAAVAAVASVVAMLRAGRAAPSDQTAVIQTAQLTTLVSSLMEQSNRDRESVQQALAAGAKGTTEQLQLVGERLSIIDRAQQQIEELKGQVVDLVGILGSNQARGAFGEVRLEQIVEDVLPAELYEFQATLSNRARVDCLIRFGERGGDLAVDSKFPLESYRTMIAAGDDATRGAAERQFKSDVKKHVDDIALKYLIKGETRDLALMFIPAESIYGELLQHFAELVDYASKRRVYLASPNTIHGWLTNLRSVYIDTKIAAQASLIQREVRLIIDDVGRLGERVESLEGHFGQAQRDIENIKISSKKVLDRGEKIERVELSSGDDFAGPALKG